MIKEQAAPTASTAALRGGGEMGERMRTFDWSKTPLGPAECWSPALRMAVQLLLANRFPMLLWWGPTFCSLYNDAYAPILGVKHPWALGRPVSECWSEIWDVLQPLIETPFQGGAATWMDDILLEINRRGFVEETHFTIAYSPVPDETSANGIGGVLATVHEITGKVVGDRRTLALRDLGARAIEARTAADACAIAAETLARYARDVPFALLYLIDPDRKQARLAGCAGVAAGGAANPPVINLADDADATRAPWPLPAVLHDDAPQIVVGLAEVLGGAVPPGPWTDAPHTALVIPIHSNKAHTPAGCLVAGISARLQLDEPYRDFLNLVASQIATAIASAREYEAEKQRAEALAELDQAKTTFFSNVSHEFRTPLTLLLGPTEDALASPAQCLRGEALATVHRNAQRLLKLVNTLLDFARIEAGRIEACYEPVDLATLTADLASVFRSTVEKAGLHLVVDCPPLPEPVYVDREMWEKIVLNLLSNAFKFTFAGTISVTLRWQGDHAELAVRDTGTGIPPEQLPHLFERFHRIPNARSRTQEGTGIGLALVKELVRYHGGSIGVASTVDQGTTFTVSIPTGCAHLPAARLRAARTLVSTALGAQPFVEEAWRWLPDTASPNGARREAGGVADLGVTTEIRNGGDLAARVLVADDNADLRHYLRQLLSPHWSVEVVPDGAAALAALQREPPDLLVTDIMMPGLDGFELLQRLRADPATRALPVILLSARAGEEARVEGLAAGADDYLVKPFSARELVARVSGHLALARVRREAARELRRSSQFVRGVLDSLPALVVVVDRDGVITTVNERWQRVARDSEGNLNALSVGANYLEVCRRASAAGDPDAQTVLDALEAVSAGQRPEASLEYACPMPDGERWFLMEVRRLSDDSGSVVVSHIDITARKQAETALERVRDQLAEGQRIAHLGSWEYIAATQATVWSDELKRIYGLDPTEPSPAYEAMLRHHIHPEDAAELDRQFQAAVENRGPFENENRIIRPDGTIRWIYNKAQPYFDPHGHLLRYVGATLDITERKRAEQALQEEDRRKDEFLAMLAHELRNPLAPIRNGLEAFRKVCEPNPMKDRLLDMLQRQVTHLTSLVDDLLDISRITRGKIELKKERVRVSSVVDHALELARPWIEAKQHELAVNLPSASIWIEGDPIRLTQVLANLLNNAAKYMEPGGRIHVAVETQGKQVQVSVRDQGIGIAADVLPQVFDLFTQAERSLDRAQGGLGIGLALVRRLVELHGGTVTAHSAGVGCGSEFVVRLPVCAESLNEIH